MPKFLKLNKSWLTCSDLEEWFNQSNMASKTDSSSIVRAPPSLFCHRLFEGFTCKRSLKDGQGAKWFCFATKHIELSANRERPRYPTRDPALHQQTSPHPILRARGSLRIVVKRSWLRRRTLLFICRGISSWLTRTEKSASSEGKTVSHHTSNAIQYSATYHGAFKPQRYSLTKQRVCLDSRTISLWQLPTLGWS
jgi:hypothetical protein